MRTRMMIAGLATAVGVTVGAVAAQNPRAGQAPPAAGRSNAAPTPSTCGNPPESVKNVAKDSRCFELRTYVVNPEGPGNLDLLHRRFREQTNTFFKKHGMTMIGFWSPVDKPDTLIYLLAFKDAAARDAAWAAFNADPGWIKARTEMNVRLTVTNQFMNATDYSPMK